MIETLMLIKYSKAQTRKHHKNTTTYIQSPRRKSTVPIKAKSEVASTSASQQQKRHRFERKNQTASAQTSDPIQEWKQWKEKTNLVGCQENRKNHTNLTSTQLPFFFFFGNREWDFPFLLDFLRQGPSPFRRLWFCTVRAILLWWAFQWEHLIP